MTPATAICTIVIPVAAYMSSAGVEKRALVPFIRSLSGTVTK